MNTKEGQTVTGDKTVYGLFPRKILNATQF